MIKGPSTAIFLMLLLTGSLIVIGIRVSIQFEVVTGQEQKQQQVPNGDQMIRQSPAAPIVQQLGKSKTTATTEIGSKNPIIGTTISPTLTPKLGQNELILKPFNPYKVPISERGLCGDGIDNDNDGKTDYIDRYDCIYESLMVQQRKQQDLQAQIKEQQRKLREMQEEMQKSKESSEFEDISKFFGHDKGVVSSDQLQMITLQNKITQMQKAIQLNQITYEKLHNASKIILKNIGR